MEMLGDRGGRGGIVVEPGAAPPARGGQAANKRCYVSQFLASCQQIVA